MVLRVSVSRLSSDALPVPAMIQLAPAAPAAPTKPSTSMMSVLEFTHRRNVSSAIRAIGVKVVMSTPRSG